MSTAPGWYTDSDDETVTSYWDGGEWSNQRHWDGSDWVETDVAARAAVVTPTVSLPTVSLSAFTMPKLPVASWLLLAGSFLAAIGVFLPWEQDIVGGSYLGGAAGTVTAGCLLRSIWPAER